MNEQLITNILNMELGSELFLSKHSENICALIEVFKSPLKADFKLYSHKDESILMIERIG